MPLLYQAIMLKARCETKDLRLVELELRVKELEEDEKVHDDVVAKLALSLEGLTTRKKKTSS